MQTSCAKFLQIYGLLSHPDSLVRQKANRDLLRFQDDPDQDIWKLSKMLLDSVQIPQQILGSQLLSRRCLESAITLNLQERSELVQYIVLRTPNIQHRGVRVKLAESLAKLLFGRGDAQEWVKNLQDVFRFMESSTQNLLFGLEIIGNLSEDTSHVGADLKASRETHIKEIITYVIKMDSKKVKQEATKALLSWVINGLPILQDHRLLQLVIQSTSSIDLSYSSNILESAVSYLYSKNKSLPLLVGQVSLQTKTSIEWIVDHIVQLAKIMYNQQSCQTVAELSTSVLSKVSWIYDSAGDQIISHMLLILKHPDRNISSQAIFYFIQLSALKLPIASIVSYLNRAVEIVLTKCLLIDLPNDQFSDYRYHSRQLLQTVYSTYLSLQLKSECSRLLQNFVVNFMGSNDNYLKQLGTFCLLSIQGGFKESQGVEWLNKQVILFCCAQSTFDPLETNCLKLLSTNCTEAIQLGLQQQVVESCILRLSGETNQIMNQSMNVLGLLVENLNAVGENSKLVSFLFKFYTQRSNLKEQFVHKFIETLVEFCYKLPCPSRYVLVILANEMELATASMKNLAIVLKTISIQNKRCQDYNSFLFQIKQFVRVALIEYPDGYDMQSCFAVYKFSINLMGQPLDVTDIHIIQAAIARAMTDHSKQGNMLLYLDQALQFSNLTESPVLHNWVQCNCYLFNDTLLEVLNDRASQKLTECFYKIQCGFMSNNPELYSKYSNTMKVLSNSNQLLVSTMTQPVRKAIISFYIEYSQRFPNPVIILRLLDSTFSCIHNVTSTNYLLYFKLTNIVSKKVNRELFQTTLRQVIDNYFQFKFTSETKQVLVDLLIGTSLKERANQFKSLIIDLMKLERREVSLEQFSQALNRHLAKIGK